MTRRWHENGWYFAVRLTQPVSTKPQYLAWAGRKPLIADSPLDEPNEPIYFEISQAEDEAIAKLKNEVFAL